MILVRCRDLCRQRLRNWTQVLALLCTVRWSTLVSRKRHYHLFAASREITLLGLMIPSKLAIGNILDRILLPGTLGSLKYAKVSELAAFFLPLSIWSSINIDVSCTLSWNWKNTSYSELCKTFNFSPSPRSTSNSIGLPSMSLSKQGILNFQWLTYYRKWKLACLSLQSFSPNNAETLWLPLICHLQSTSAKFAESGWVAVTEAVTMR